VGSSDSDGCGPRRKGYATYEYNVRSNADRGAIVDVVSACMSSTLTTFRLRSSKTLRMGDALGWSASSFSAATQPRASSAGSGVAPTADPASREGTPSASPWVLA
jgi:hypothetical protein